MDGDQLPSTVETVKQRVEPTLQNIQEHLPDRRQAMKISAGVALGLVVLSIGGVTLTGGAIFLAFATPVFLFFSPILVPLVTVLFLGTAGVLSVLGAGAAAGSAIVWLYRYFKGEEPIYSDRVDSARTRLAGTAQDVKDWASQTTPAAASA